MPPIPDYNTRPYDAWSNWKFPYCTSMHSYFFVVFSFFFEWKVDNGMIQLHPHLHQIQSINFIVIIRLHISIVVSYIFFFVVLVIEANKFHKMRREKKLELLEIDNLHTKSADSQRFYVYVQNDVRLWERPCQQFSTV